MMSDSQIELLKSTLSALGVKWTNGFSHMGRWEVIEIDSSDGFCEIQFYFKDDKLDSIDTYFRD